MEATFRTLSTTKYWEKSVAGQGLLVTVSSRSMLVTFNILTGEQGKGYPDLVTRSFLHKVHNTRPGMPIYALVDYDPDGVNIFRCYKWGSAALEHEEEAKLPSLQWLGIKSCDLRDTPNEGPMEPPIESNTRPQPTITSRRVTTPPAGPSNRPLRLTQRDRKLAVKLLGDLANETDHDGVIAEAVLELQRMLMANMKAEIQAMNDDGDISTYLERKLVGSH